MRSDNVQNVHGLFVLQHMVHLLRDPDCEGKLNVKIKSIKEMTHRPEQ